MEERGFAVIRCLGQGAQGRVYEARDSSGKLRVIKQLPWVNQVNREDAEREMRLLSALRHPCIVPYLDNFLMRSTPSLPSEDLLCIVMSRCEHDLRHECITRRQQGVPVEELGVLSWLAQLCWGLQHLHSRKFLHRDLKPQNVLLTQSARVLLADFGVACHLERTEDFRSTRVGTFAFMSPEMLEGKPYGRKTDQWALGCVLFEIMTLEAPFANCGFITKLKSEVSKELCAQVPDRYGSDLVATLGALLATKADDRPSNAELLRSPLLRASFHAFVQSLEAAATLAATAQDFDGGVDDVALLNSSPRDSLHSSPQRPMLKGGSVTANMQDFLHTVSFSSASAAQHEDPHDHHTDIWKAVPEEASTPLGSRGKFTDFENYFGEYSPLPSDPGDVAALGSATGVDSPSLGAVGLSLWPTGSPISGRSGSADQDEQTFILGAGLDAGEWRHLLDEAEALLQPMPENSALEEVEKMRRALVKLLGSELQVDKALNFLRERQPLDETDDADCDELLLQVELLDLIGDDSIKALPLLERYLSWEQVVRDG